jgi:hypothetical protein
MLLAVARVQTAAVQAFGEQAHPLAVVPLDLHQTTPLAADCKQVPAMRVALQRLLHQQRQPVEDATQLEEIK